MSKNVRRYDQSCKQLGGDTAVTFYQCTTCDKSGLLYICEECYRENDHDKHKTKQATATDKVPFCSCGDITGIYECSSHERVHMEAVRLPLHANKEYLDDFCNRLNIKLGEAMRLSHLNQIRKLYHLSKEGKMITEYFENSNAHDSDISIKSVWSVYRKDFEEYFVEEGLDKTRRLLLWHGTRNKNLAGILENGFKRPASGTVTVANGAMFGTGCYFADRVSKSAGYITKSMLHNRGLLFLCEVALGSMWRTGLPKNYKDVPNNFDSIKGVGKMEPDRSHRSFFDGDVIVPAGKTVPNNHPKIVFSKLKYNEFIVFDTRRVLIKFIVQIEKK